MIKISKTRTKYFIYDSYSIYGNKNSILLKIIEITSHSSAMLLENKSENVS